MSGVAPMLSPADTITVFALVALSAIRCAAMNSAPPASVWPIRPLEPDGGSRLPWKSLMASSCTSTTSGGRSAVTPAQKVTIKSTTAEARRARDPSVMA